MNTRTLFFALSASILLMVGCQKEDRIVPDTSNPFYGIYSPSGQIKEVGSDSVTLFTTQWIGRRLASICLDDITNQYYYDSHNRLASVDSNIFCTYSDDKLLSSVKIILNDRTRTLMFRYNGNPLPSMVIDSIFYHSSIDINEWYSTSSAYRLEWEKGNLVKATPVDAGKVGMNIFTTKTTTLSADWHYFPFSHRTVFYITRHFSVATTYWTLSAITPTAASTTIATTATSSTTLGRK